MEFSNPREAQDAGIVIVHQELNMLGHLTVAQNIFIGREFMKGKLIDDKKMNEEARKLFDQLGIDIDPTETMSRLTVGKQQMCEIAKAISHDAKVIIFDEPSAALTEAEIEELFKIIRDLRKKQMGIVYISHRMDEIKVITDRVTVMRDGGYVGTLITKDCTKDDIINMMVGRVIYEDPKTESAVAKDAPVVLKVEHLNAGTDGQGCKLRAATRGDPWLLRTDGRGQNRDNEGAVRSGSQAERRYLRKWRKGRDQDAAGRGTARHRIPFRGPQALRHRRR